MEEWFFSTQRRRETETRPRVSGAALGTKGGRPREIKGCAGFDFGRGRRERGGRFQVSCSMYHVGSSLEASANSAPTKADEAFCRISGLSNANSIVLSSSPRLCVSALKERCATSLILMITNSLAGVSFDAETQRTEENNYIPFT